MEPHHAHYTKKKEKENVEEERENYEQLDNTNKNLKTHFNSNWNQNKSYLTIYQEISHLKHYSMILFKSLPLRLRTLRDRTLQITCLKDIY